MIALARGGAVEGGPRLDPGEGEILTLFERLRSAGWRVEDRCEPLALCFCALSLRLNPLIETQRIAESLDLDNPVFERVDLANAMARLGWREDPLSVRLDDLDPRLTPCLFLLGADQAREAPRAPVVALKSLSADGIERCQLFDGAEAEMRDAPPASPAGRMRGEAVVFRRIDRIRVSSSPEARRLSGQGWFASTLGRFSPQLRRILYLGMALNLLALAAPMAVMLMYDRVIGPRSADPLLHLAVGFAIVVWSEATLRRARASLLTSLSARMDFLVGVAILEKILALPAPLSQRASVSDQIARIKTFESIRDAFCGPVMMSALDAPAALLSLLAIYLLVGPLVVVPLVSVGLFMAIFYLTWRRTRVRIREAALESSILQQFALETFDRLEDIQVDGLSERWGEKFRDILGRESVALLRLRRLGAVSEHAGQALVGLTTLAFLYFGVRGVWAGEASTGGLIAGMMLLWRTVAPFHNLSSMVPRFEQIRNSIRQIDALMDAPEEERSDRPTMRASRLRGEIAFANVAVRYDAQSAVVFAGLDLQVRAGEVIGVTGPSGSGKSTLLKLLLGMQQPLLGAVRFDGFDIRQLDQRELREQIAYLPQEAAVFSASVLDNVRIAAPLADDAAVLDALRRAGVAEDDPLLRDGPGALLKPTDFQALGQLTQRRIALARAIVRPRVVLALDDQPSDALLAGMDADIRRVVAAARGRSTVFLVSSRADLLRMADRIVALTPGAAPRVGAPDNILAAA